MVSLQLELVLEAVAAVAKLAVLLRRVGRARCAGSDLCFARPRRLELSDERRNLAFEAGLVFDELRAVLFHRRELPAHFIGHAHLLQLLDAQSLTGLAGVLYLSSGLWMDEEAHALRQMP